jgi:hypothetical protein
LAGIQKTNAMRNQRLVVARDPAPTGAVSANNNAGNSVAQTSSASQQQNRQSENNLAIVLIGIVIMHLVSI